MEREQGGPPARALSSEGREALARLRDRDEYGAVLALLRGCAIDELVDWFLAARGLEDLDGLTEGARRELEAATAALEGGEG